MTKIDGYIIIAKFLPWTVVTFTKIGITRGTDLEGRDDNFTLGFIERVSNTIKHWYTATGTAA